MLIRTQLASTLESRVLVYIGLRNVDSYFEEIKEVWKMIINISNILK